jgi:hypothetical protein
MKHLSNPNLIYIITFSIPFLVYSLGWSTLYPELTDSLLLFYSATFLFCVVAGVILSSIVKFKYVPISEFAYNKHVLVILFLFYLVDIAYSGYVPLIAYTSGVATYDTNPNYGIPTIHVIMVTFNLFFSFYVFHQFLSSKKKSLLIVYILTIMPFVILVMRSNIMYIIIGSLFISTLSRRFFSIPHLLRLVVFCFGTLYLFGYLGNLRSSNGDSTFIPRNSGVTEEFLDGWVPNEFYWGYLYIASPVASLQNNINTEKKVEPDFKSFFVIECIPDFISKKVGAAVDVKQRNFNQLNNFLNVGTIYANAFSYLSWTGMIIMFVYLMTFMNVYYILVSKSDTFKMTGYAIMFNVIAFGNFSNTLQFSAFSFPLIYPIIFSMILYIVKNRKRRFIAIHNRVNTVNH